MVPVEDRGERSCGRRLAARRHGRIRQPDVFRKVGVPIGIPGLCRQDDGYKVMGQIKQDLDLFRMPLELEVTTDGDPEYNRVDVSGQSSDFDVLVDRKPKDVPIDPRKKVLRMSNDIKISVYINRGEEL